MNILITGSNGFIGSTLAKALSQHNVVSYTRSQYGDIAEIDFDKLPISNFDVVYHLASTVHNYHILDNPYIDVQTNCIGTIKILENMRKYCPLCKLVFVSTFFVNNGNPLGLYGASKLFAENACRIYSKVFNIDVSIARLCNVFGCGESTTNNKKNAFMRLVLRLYRHESIDLYDELVYRDLIYIYDVISALTIIAEKGRPQHIYTVGTGTKHIFKDVIFSIKEYLHSNSEIVLIKPPEFHKQVGVLNFTYETESLQALGWNPKFSILDGVADMLLNHTDFQVKQ